MLAVPQRDNQLSPSTSIFSYILFTVLHDKYIKQQNTSSKQAIILHSASNDTHNNNISKCQNMNGDQTNKKDD